MPDLKHRQQKIQEKRKKTPWREFVREIASWKPLTFYKQGKSTSIYPSKRVHRIVEKEQFHNQMQDNIDAQSFFASLDTLIQDIGYTPLNQMNTENSSFADTVIASKNIYLSNTVITGCENVLYSLSVKDTSTNIFNSIMVRDNCENVYYSQAIIKSYAIFHSNQIENSSHLYFCSNMIGCHDCILSDGLENVSYYIKNKQYLKAEYYRLLPSILEQLHIHYTGNYLKKGKNILCKDTLGHSNTECISCESAYFSHCVNKGRNIFLTGSAEGADHMYDCITGGSPYGSHFYGVMGAGASEHIYCSIFINGGSSNIYYSLDMESCSYCLGCIGLKNKQFCIFNKQYTKDEWHTKVDEIFTAMEKEGTLGNFFPGSMNPFYFNDTAAYLIDDSFTKEEVEAEGYLWRDEPIKVDIPAGVQTVGIDELGKYEGWKEAQSGKLQAASKKGELEAGSLELDAGAKRYIDPEILKKVIVDEAGNAYRIIPMEYDFLMKYGLPLPRKHWLERLKGHFRVK